MFKGLKDLFISEVKIWTYESDEQYVQLEDHVLDAIDRMSSETEVRLNPEYISMFLKKLRDSMQYKYWDPKPQDAQELALDFSDFLKSKKYDPYIIWTAVKYMRDWLLSDTNTYSAQIVDMLNAVTEATFANKEIQRQTIELLKNNLSEETKALKSMMHAPKSYKDLYDKYKRNKELWKIEQLKNIQFVMWEKWTIDIDFTKLWITLQETLWVLSSSEFKDLDVDKFHWNFELPTEQDIREMIQVCSWETYSEDSRIFLDFLGLKSNAQIYIAHGDKKWVKCAHIWSNALKILKNSSSTTHLFLVKRDKLSKVEK